MDCGGHIREAHKHEREAGHAGHDLERHSSMYALVILN